MNGAIFPNNKFQFLFKTIKIDPLFINIWLFQGLNVAFNETSLNIEHT